jgi:site-specific recombinase XerD
MDSTFHLEAFEATSEQVALYVVHLHNCKLKANTIRSHLSSIAFMFQASQLPTPTESFSTSKLLHAYAKSDPPPFVRKPITHSVLKDIINALKRLPYSSHDRLLLQALFSLMYHALLRISEVTPSKKHSHNLKAKHICISTVKPKQVSVTFKTFKFSKPGVTKLLIPPADISSCPVKAYARYAQVRFPNSTSAFCRQNGSLLSPSYVTKQLRYIINNIGLAPQDYNNHSFRIGRATDMARVGFTDTQICMAGRWSSSAFTKYIKPQLLRITNT